MNHPGGPGPTRCRGLQPGGAVEVTQCPDHDKSTVGRAKWSTVGTIRKNSITMIPKHSTYRRFAYIEVVSVVNVGKYSIHGLSGIYFPTD